MSHSALGLGLEVIRRDPACLEAAVEAVRRSVGRPAFPSLDRSAHRGLVRAVAERQGLLESIRTRHPVGDPIPVLRRSAFRLYERQGNRTPFDSARHALGRRLDAAACAVYLGEEGYLDELQDLAWALCETTWWILPAHHPHSAPIDLGVAMAAETLARLDAVFGDLLEDEVRSRMEAEVRRRVLDPFLDPATQSLSWRRITNNWNAVCHTGVGIAAMVYEKDSGRLAATFRSIFQNLPVFLDGFTQDGGCSEGPGYWRYGFGWYARLADTLHAFTAGDVDLLAGDLPPRIARYPLSVALAAGQDLSFSDTHPAHMALETAALLNRHLDVPELFGLCAKAPAGDDLRLASFGDLLTYPDAVPPVGRGFLDRDAVLPELGIAKLHGADGLILGVKAGHNAEHHNHNDVGSFLVFHRNVQLLCDPGAPVYSRATFSARRYESVFTNSRGHNVPVVDGLQQSAGERFRGTLRIVDSGGAKQAVVEFAQAYALPALRSLTRTLTLSSATPEVLLEDRFGFEGSPLPVEEAFLTTFPADCTEEGTVVVRADNGAVGRLSALVPGIFAVETLTEESRESPSGALLRRIVFRPDWSAGGEAVVRLRFVAE